MIPPPPRSDEALSLVQRWFQSVITHPDGIREGILGAQPLLPLAPDDLERMITPSSKLSSTERLSVYANAYYSRLTECLSEVFPSVRKTVGDDGFNDFAIDYLQTFPSRTYTLNSLGLRFPEYLESVRPERAVPDAPDWADFVIDLARFDWGVYEVFDGPGNEGQPPFDFGALPSIPAQQWSNVRLKTSPCLRLLKSRFPVNDYFTNLRAGTDGEIPATPDPADSYVALVRHDFVVRRFGLTKIEFQILSKLVAGASLGETLSNPLGCEQHDADESITANLSDWFAWWSREQFFTGFSLEPQLANEAGRRN